MTMPSADLAYRSRAVRALVLLHDEHVRRFIVVWNQAQAASVVLPKTHRALGTAAVPLNVISNDPLRGIPPSARAES